jgi:hypothetical protein
MTIILYIWRKKNTKHSSYSWLTQSCFIDLFLSYHIHKSLLHSIFYCTNLSYQLKQRYASNTFKQYTHRHLSNFSKEHSILLPVKLRKKREENSTNAVFLCFRLKKKRTKTRNISYFLLSKNYQFQYQIDSEAVSDKNARIRTIIWVYAFSKSNSEK